MGFLRTMVLVTVACSQGEAAPSRHAMQQGREYTAWLYQKHYHKLWQRMTPEMHELFASPEEFAAFAGRAFTRLGPERGAVREDLSEAAGERIYSRTAEFSGAARPVLLQLVMTRKGHMSGIVIRPLEPDTRDSIAKGD